MGKGRKKKSKGHAARNRARKRHERSVKRRGHKSSGPDTGWQVNAADPEHMECILDLLDQADADIEVLARRLGRHPYCVQQQVAAHTEKHSEPLEGPIAACAVRMESLSDDEVVGRIESFGVRTDRAAFLGEAKGFDSAWFMARERWLGRTGRDNDPPGRTMLCLAACELWKHWLPDRPSIEMLHDDLHFGYEAEEDGDIEGATRRWLDLWDRLGAHLSGATTSTGPLSERIACVIDLSHWCRDFAATASHAALHDSTLAAPSLRALEAMCAQFSAEDPEIFQIPLRIYSGDLLFVLGRFADGEELLMDLIAAHPRDPQPYSALADLLSDPRFGLERGGERAVEVLERAVALPVEDVDSWDIPRQLSQLRRTLRADS